ncbi:uncharacterized protein CMC5_069920 [Chondromyces crocatus]|uniref:Uncharacterized protein n=2 Tax=Chondromyces crocatus TaxID=52 RepID=A0A0K1EPC2_CHOCO|nr:uncharacterized protein CMC5_069920 [Chondromyces crocatus]
MLVAIALSVAVAPGCSKGPEVTSENIAEQAALIEQHDGGSVVWRVKPDGQVMALLKAPDGKPIEQGVTGTMTVKPKTGDPVTATLVPVEKSGGVLTATLPKLDDELTEVSYTLLAADKPIQGTLHLPKGGTEELFASAKVSAEAKLDDKKGPNGGVLQVVGEDTVEIVANDATGEVRVYLLDDNLQVVKPENRKIKIKLGLSGSGAEVIELSPHTEGLYFEGKLNAQIKPKKMTVVLVDGDVVHTALWGHHPGKVVVIGVGAPVIAIFVNTVVWVAPVVVVKHKHHHHHHHKGKGKGKGKWKVKAKAKGGSIKISF